MCHYIDENSIRNFFRIHEPNCQIYSYLEQMYYMKVCRIAIYIFLKNEITLVCLTSKRMSQAKRKDHLIARDALLELLFEVGH
jgi:hypothetical protein